MQINIDPDLIPTLDRLAVENNQTSLSFAAHILNQYLKSQFKTRMFSKIQEKADIATMKKFEAEIDKVYDEMNAKVAEPVTIDPVEAVEK